MLGNHILRDSGMLAFLGAAKSSYGLQQRTHLLTAELFLLGGVHTAQTVLRHPGVLRVKQLAACLLRDSILQGFQRKHAILPRLTKTMGHTVYRSLILHTSTPAVTSYSTQREGYSFFFSRSGFATQKRIPFPSCTYIPLNGVPFSASFAALIFSFSLLILSLSSMFNEIYNTCQSFGFFSIVGL